MAYWEILLSKGKLSLVSKFVIFLVLISKISENSDNLSNQALYLLIFPETEFIYSVSPP